MKLTRASSRRSTARALVFYFTADGARRFPRARARAGRANSTRGSRCARSACATKRRCSAATARAAGRSAARRSCRRFEPVSIKMAKQQDLSLNPSKLSGLCGRLKCCLRYELPNAKGVVHGGCGDEGGCDNPIRLRLGRLRAAAAAAAVVRARTRRNVVRSDFRLRISDFMKPRVAITAGDPAGIGPEIAAARGG